MVAAVLLGLLIGAALGALGGGGSILAVPVLVHLAGQTPLAATSTSLVAVGAAAAVGAVSHARAGRVRWGAALAFTATGVAGSWAGSQLSGEIDGDVLLLAFSGLVLVAAHRMLTACPSCTREGEDEAMAAEGVGASTGAAGGASAASAGDPGSGATPSTAARATAPTVAAVPPARTITLAGAARVALAGSAVGFLTGLFGVGGGFVIVPALTLALGMNMPTAIGTSLAVIVGNALTALGFRGLDAVDWSVALPFTATMLVGSVLGSRVAHRLPAKQSLTAFATLLVAVAIANGVAAAAAIWG